MQQLTGKIFPLSKPCNSCGILLHSGDPNSVEFFQWSAAVRASCVGNRRKQSNRLAAKDKWYTVEKGPALLVMPARMREL